MEMHYPDEQKNTFPIESEKERKRREKFLERRRADMEDINSDHAPFWINGSSQATNNKISLHPFEQVATSGAAPKVDTKTIFLSPPETAKYALLTKHYFSTVKGPELIPLTGTENIQLTLLRDETAVVAYNNKDGYPISFENV